MCSVGSGRQASLSWQPGSNGQVPYNAIQAGAGVFVGRSRIGADVTPGKVCSGHNVGHFPYGGKEEVCSNYEVLCDTGLHVFGPEISWISAFNGSVPPNAVVGGNTSSNEPLYICRGYVNGSMCVGKVAQSHGCSFLPHGGTEHRVPNYEVLCYSH